MTATAMATTRASRRGGGAGSGDDSALMLSPAISPRQAMAGAASAGSSHSQSTDACASQATAETSAAIATGSRARPLPGLLTARHAIARKPLRSAPPTMPVCPNVRRTMLWG